MSDLIDTTEMYLKVVFELEEQRQPALRARLAERLEQAMPSVSQTVSRLERDGLLRLGDERIVELTDEGREPPAGPIATKKRVVGNTFSVMRQRKNSRRSSRTSTPTPTATPFQDLTTSDDRGTLLSRACRPPIVLPRLPEPSDR